MTLFVTNLSAHGVNDKTLISPAELNSRIHEYKVLDLRSSREYAVSHIPGAYSVPLKALSEQKLQGLAIIPPDSLALYSISELQAQKGKLLLEILGYETIRILAGGFTHWVEDGYKVDSGTAIPAASAEQEHESGLVVTPAMQDLGVILKKNGVVSVGFAIRNISDGEISIKNITTSCGCTSAEVDADLIMPGETSRLTVFFDPDFHKEPEGRFSRTVFMETSENKEITAQIQVEIKE